MRPIHLAAAFLAAVPLAARAQDTAAVAVHAGSPLVDARRVAMRTDSFEMRWGGGETAMLVIRTAALGDTALLRVERISAGPSVLSTDSFAARRPTLEPLYDDEQRASSHQHFTFNHGRVFGKTTGEGGDARPVSATLDPPAFYLNTSDLLLASLPLAQGRAFDVALWGAEKGAYTLHARVVRAETVPTLEGGRCEAWRVETRGEGDDSVYWVERRSQSLLAYSSGELRLTIARHAACRADIDAPRATR